MAEEQLAGVELTRQRVPAALAGLCKTQRIAAYLASPKPDRVTVNLENLEALPLRRFQHRAQAAQGRAQTVTPGANRHAGPQQFDQLFSGMGPVRPQRQAGQQRHCSAAGQTGDALAAAAELEAAEQSQLPQRIGGFARGVACCLQRVPSFAGRPARTQDSPISAAADRLQRALPALAPGGAGP